MSTRLAIYGVGNFGYAWVKHFDQMQDAPVSIVAYDRNPEVIDSLRSSGQHPFLHEGVTIADTVTFVSSPEELVTDADVVLLAVTSDATAEVIEQIKPHLKDGVTLVNTAKALDSTTGERLSQVVKASMGDQPYMYALLAGGTIASDLFAHEPLGIDLACEYEGKHSDLVALFESPNLSVYPTADLAGVEYASAFKNVIAILAGIISGMGFSYGSETHIISRAANEIEQLVTTQLSGRPETFRMKSQCWGNDLWMSCTGKTRNRAFGELLGQGMSVADAIDTMQKQHKTVEGIHTIAVLDHIPGAADYPLLAFLHGYIAKQQGSLDDLKNSIFSQTF